MSLSSQNKRGKKMSFSEVLAEIDSTEFSTIVAVVVMVCLSVFVGLNYLTGSWVVSSALSVTFGLFFGSRELRRLAMVPRQNSQK